MIAVEERKYHCGEVFVTNNTYRVTVECKFCDKHFTAYNKFLSHIFDDHFDNIDNEEFTNESLEFEDMEVLKALETNEDIADNDYDATTEIVEEATNIETVESSQSMEMTLTNAENECDYTENGGNLSTEISNITAEVEKENTDDAQRSETVEPSPASNNSYFRPVIIKYQKRREGEERKYKCKFCDITFAKVVILRKHEQRHSDNKPFSCSKCPKKFFSRTELETHIRWHTGERPFVCTYCGNCYTTNSALRLHEKRHVGERTHKCDYCDKKFYEGFHLRQHIVVHTKERKYSCDQCQAKFTRSKALRMHMKLHENALSYKCSICSMRFNQKPTLAWHEKSKHDIVRGGAAVGATANNCTVRKSSDKTLDNVEAEYKRKSDDSEYEDNDSLLKHHSEVHVAVDDLTTFEALTEADNEYIDFI